MIKLGCIDINIKMSLLSSYSAMPRQGSLEAALHIMSYLKLRHNFRLAFYPFYPNIDHSNFWECDCTDFYEGTVEAISPNAPLQRGEGVDLSMFIDSNHAGDKWTRRSMIRFMIYMNMSLIDWNSKIQSIMETLVFGREVVVMMVRIKTLCII